MSRRSIAIGILGLTVAILPSVAQTRSAASQKPARKSWTPARTPDGQPDLQGTWTNPTITPFERPQELADKATLSDQEAAQLENRAAQSRVDRAPTEGDVGSYNQFWFDSGTKVVSTHQT